MSETQKRSERAHRKQIHPDTVMNAVAETRKKLLFRLMEQKGYGTWTSRHEILGFLTEEYAEVVEAVHSGSLDELKEELLDVAVGCIFAIACINSKTLDW
ncbi:MAG: MazG nucleotide pyrophosphohydrolase domain-containing protein [Candidatus Omnitrophota bacterium]|jgi:NTP pyrophosphatase (non-canonical NTP hydrolase)